MHVMTNTSSLPRFIVTVITKTGNKSFIQGIVHFKVMRLDALLDVHYLKEISEVV